MTSLIGESFQFESHSGFGGDDPDGEPWPFGYISTSPTPQPVFELNVILGFDEDELQSLARKMAAAPKLLEMLKHAVHWHDQITAADVERYSAVIAEAEGIPR